MPLSNSETLFLDNSEITSNIAVAEPVKEYISGQIRAIFNIYTSNKEEVLEVF